MFLSSKRGPRLTRSTYIPADSPIHHLPAGAKALTVIAVLLLTALFVTSIPVAGLVLVLTLVLYAVARIPWRAALLNLRTPIPVLLILCGLLWWRVGFSVAAHRFLVLYAAVALAILLTLTTRVSDMLDSLERGLRPLERFGFPVDSVTLALSLTMRLIPLQWDLVNEVLDARKARGVSGSPLAFGVPVIVRSLLRAKAVGDALISRGVGD